MNLPRFFLSQTFFLGMGKHVFDHQITSKIHVWILWWLTCFAIPKKKSVRAKWSFWILIFVVIFLHRPLLENCQTDFWKTDSIVYSRILWHGKDQFMENSSKADDWGQKTWISGLDMDRFIETASKPTIKSWWFFPKSVWHISLRALCAVADLVHWLSLA